MVFFQSSSGSHGWQENCETCNKKTLHKLSNGVKVCTTCELRDEGILARHQPAEPNNGNLLPEPAFKSVSDSKYF